jgi:uracil-DNA glycosylase
MTLTTDASQEYGVHPLLMFDRGCQSCALGRGEAVGGAGPDDLENLKLIVISDHPGHYESKIGYPFYDNTPEREQRYQSALRDSKKSTSVYKAALLGTPNAGCLIRDLLREELGLNSYTQVWMTNVLKCNRKLNAPNLANEVKPCVTKWLATELRMLKSFEPKTPILIAGTLAYRGFKLVDPIISKILPGKIENARQQVFYWEEQPIVVTYNPVVVSDCVPRIETRIGRSASERAIVQTVKEIVPRIKGSPLDNYIEDILLLKKFLN